MPQIYLTPDQVQTLTEAGEAVEVFGPGDELLGNLKLFSPQEREAIARYKRRNPHEAGIPGERVQTFLQQLHEVDAREGIDEAKVLDLLQRVQVESRP